MVSQIVAAAASFFHVYLVTKGIKMTPHLPCSPILSPAAFFSCPESEVRAGKPYVDPGHLQEDAVGVALWGLRDNKKYGYVVW